MKFTDNRTKRRVLFGDIKVGECFITHCDGHINMKMYIADHDYPDVRNTVDLITGKQFAFEDNEEVISVNAEVTAID